MPIKNVLIGFAGAVAGVILLVSVASGTAIYPTIAPTPTSYYYGDFDGDSAITTMDTNVLLNLLNGKAYTFGALQPDNPDQDWNTCDIDSDMACTTMDKNVYLNYLTGKQVDIDDKPWVISSPNLSGAIYTVYLFVPFNANVSSKGGTVGRAGVAVTATIHPIGDGFGSATIGHMSGRLCDPNPEGEPDQPTVLGVDDQCALAVTITDWVNFPSLGLTESGQYGLRLSADAPGTIAIELAIQDNGLGVPALTTTIYTYISQNHAPAWMTPPSTITVTDGSIYNQVNGTAQASDDGQTVTCSSNGTTCGFAVTVSGGGWWWGPCIVNFTAPLGAQSCDLRITVTDNGLPALTVGKTIPITVANHYPTWQTAPTDITTNIGSTYNQTNGVVQDSDTDQTLTCSNNGANCGFAITVSGSGSSPVACNISFTEPAVNDRCYLRVMATDNGTPALTVGHTICISPPNYPPTWQTAPTDVNITGGSSYNKTNGIAQDANTGQILTCSSNGTSCGFTVNVSGSGANPQNCNVSFTAPTLVQMCNLRITATDNGAPPLSIGQTISITVKQHAPKWSTTPSSITIPTGSTYNHTNGVATDVDTGETLTCSNNGSTCAFGITVSGSGASPVNCNVSFTTPLVSRTCSLRISVADNGAPVLSVGATISITVTNHAPTWQTAPTNIAITVGSIYNQTNGIAQDVDAGQTLTCSSNGTSCGFTITVSGAGSSPLACNISFTEPTSFQTCNLRVMAADNVSPALTVGHTISITDNHAPTWQATPTNITITGGSTYNQNNGTAQDVDAGQVLTCSSNGTSCGFAITVSGAGASPENCNASFTAPVSAQTCNLRITVADDAAPPFTVGSTISITVKNNAPTWQTAPTNITITGGSAYYQTNGAAQDVDTGQTLTCSSNGTTCGFTITVSGSGASPRNCYVSFTAPYPDQTCNLRIQATDNGSPSLSVGQTISITVKRPPPYWAIAPIPISTRPGQAYNQINGKASEADTGKTFTCSNNGTSCGFAITVSGSGYNPQYCTLRFVPQDPEGSCYLRVMAADNGSPSLTIGKTIRIYVSRWIGIGSGSASGGGISNNSGNSTQPKLALDSSGNPVVAWQDTTLVTPEIYIRRWNPNSSAWAEIGTGSASGAGISNTSVSNGAQVPSLALDLGGNPVVAWQDYSYATPEIYIKRWNAANGGTWEQIIPGSASGGGISNSNRGAVAPSLALDSTGNPVVSWTDSSSGNSQIYIRRWNPTGGTWDEIGAGSASGGGISNSSAGSYVPSLTLDSSGNPVVAWQNGGAGGNAEIYIKRWNPTGGTWDEIGVGSASGGGISNNSGWSLNPSLALDSSGNPVVAWYDWTYPTSTPEIYIRRFDPGNGGSWVEIGAGSASGMGISNSAVGAVQPSLALDSAGNPVVAWEEGTFWGKGYYIYIRRWNATGGTWDEIGPNSASDKGISDNIPPTQYGAYYPSLALDSSGNPFVAWVNDSIYFSQEKDIYIKRYQPGNLAPSWLTTPSNITITGGSTYNQTDGVATDIDTETLACYSSGTTCGFTIDVSGSGGNPQNCNVSFTAPIPAQTCSLRISAADSGAPPLTVGKTIYITTRNHFPTWSTVPGDITITGGSVYNQTNGVATDVDTGQTLTCSSNGTNCAFTITVSGSGLPANCNISFTAISSTQTCSLRVKVADNGTPALSVGQTITINITGNHLPTWQTAPSNIFLPVGSTYNQTNGVAMDIDAGQTLSCSLVSTTCSFGVSVSGSGPNTGVNCNISFTAGASHEICGVFIQVSDDAWGNVTANFNISVDPSVSAISAGGGDNGDHTCALTTTGGVKCWGHNSYGEIGDNTTTNRKTPVDVVGLTSGVVAISAGQIHTCALTTTGGVKCWGNNSAGQLGDNSTTNRLTPVDVVGLSSGVAAISGGGFHTCALTTVGGVKCWGANGWGELGDNTSTNRLTPVDVVGLSSGVATITTGYYHTCALTTAGGAKCWGDNAYGEIGDNTTTNRYTPVDVIGLTSGVAAISAGGYHTCALTTAGGAKCWGYNYDGELGDNTSTNRLTSVDVAGLTSGVGAISSGFEHTCALTTAGGVKCWGLNNYGQVGDNTTTSRYTPVDVVGLSSEMAAISGGGYHTCALTTARGVICWGENNYGQVGDNTTTNRLSPVYVLWLNYAPTWQTAPSNIMITGGSTYNQVNGTAQDLDLGQTLTCSSNGTSCGFTVNVSGSGGNPQSCTIGFTAPVPAQTCSLRVMATDNGSPSLTVGSTISITIKNHAPTWSTMPTDITITGGSAYNQTNGAAQDVDTGQTLTCSSNGTSCGFTITISGSGASPRACNVSFTAVSPTQTCNLRVKVADNGSPSLTIGQTISIIIAGNHKPTWQTAPSNIGIHGGSIYNQTNGVATDIDTEQTLTCLSNGTTCGFTINVSGSGGNPQNCNISFTAPAVAQTCSLRVMATDNGSPAMSVGQTIVISINDPPTWSIAPSNITITGGSTYNQTDGVATDVDTGQTLTCSKNGTSCGFTITVSGSGASPRNCNLTFTVPIPMQTCNLRITATDNGSPAFSVGQTISITTVNRPPVWSTTPANITIARNAQFNQLNGSAADQNTGQTLSCSLASSTCSFGVAVSGSGPNTGIDCNISFTAGASSENCSITIQVSDDAGGAITANANIVVYESPPISAIAAGWYHTCALTTGNGAKCWGYNYYGQIGDNTTTDRFTPVDVVTLSSGVVAISLGSVHTCALTTAGGVKCWGRNKYGQLGDNTTTDRHMPVDVVGLSSGVAAISAGYYHTCALTTAGGVKCWGWNGSGQLGDNTTTNQHAPVDVIGLSSGVIAISAGGSHTCALTTAGGVKCWGYNLYGEIGDNTTTDRHTPVDVYGLSSGVAAISTGNWHTCALTTAGGAKCWGYNHYGEIGDNTTTDSSIPIDVIGLLSGVTMVDAGAYHTCAITTVGGVECWGANSYGQIGDNTISDRYTPVNVYGLSSGVATIDAGVNYTCALTIMGEVECWGWNQYGQLGDNTSTDRHTPVYVIGW